MRIKVSSSSSSWIRRAGSWTPCGTFKKDKEGDPEGVMEKKVLNDTIAYARSLAQKRNRNVKWAVDAVRRAISSTYKEALSQGVIDLVAEDMDDLIKKLDNRTLLLNGKIMTFRTKDI